MPLQTPALQSLILGRKASSGRGSNYSVLKFAVWALPPPSDSLTLGIDAVTTQTQASHNFMCR